MQYPTPSGGQATLARRLWASLCAWGPGDSLVWRWPGAAEERANRPVYTLGASPFLQSLQTFLASTGAFKSFGGLWWLGGMSHVSP